MSQKIASVVADAKKLEAFLQIMVLNAANPMDAQGAKRADNLLPIEVARFRGAIATGNRVALSATALTIPPEAEKHLLVIVCQSLATSVPQLSEFVQSDRFKDMVDKAEDWLEAVRKGELVPTAPIDPDTATVPSGPEWGDLYGQEVAGKSLGKIDVSTD